MNERHRPQNSIAPQGQCLTVSSMGLPRTFVGFSSSDIHAYRLMCAWKAHEHLDFNFYDCQLQEALNSADEAYIKRKCRERINMAGRYIMLIGQDTRSKHKYVRWEAEVAIEKGCTVIGVNLDGTRRMDHGLTPPIIRDIGAVFVPLSPHIVAHALQHYQMNNRGSWHYPDSAYLKLGYTIEGDYVKRPKWVDLWK